MKVYIANSSKQQIGGGWSFVSNFIKGLGEDYTEDYDSATYYFVPSASMIKPELAEQAKRDGKKVILRVDNFLKHSRNRGKGMSRMKHIAMTADTVIYQSRWGMNYLSPYLSKVGPVILNGVDIDLFKPLEKKNIYLYTRFNRDNSKMWEAAQYFFMRKWQKDQNIQLWIVGNFGPEMRENNFDFYNGESYKFWGVQPPEVMAQLYGQSKYFLYTYFCDACSNSLIEALVSGCEIPQECSYFSQTGGANEIISMFRTKGRDYFSIDRMVKEYKEVLSA